MSAIEPRRSNDKNVGWGRTKVRRRPVTGNDVAACGSLRKFFYVLPPYRSLRSPRAPRNLTPPSNVGTSDKPTWRCQQIPLIGALGIQVICYPRRAFQERLINDRKGWMINPWKLARAGRTRALPPHPSHLTAWYCMPDG